MEASRLATGSLDVQQNTATYELGTVPNIGKDSVSKDGKFSAIKLAEITSSLQSAPTIQDGQCKTDSLGSQGPAKRYYSQKVTEYIEKAKKQRRMQIEERDGQWFEKFETMARFNFKSKQFSFKICRKDIILF